MLSLLTAVLWGVLPLFLLLCLQAMDSPTITLYRFATAALVIGLLLFKQQRLPRLLNQPKNVLVLAILATLLLVANYVTNVIGLLYLSPSSIQVLMQIAPFLLMLGGVVFYRESFSRMQVAGAALLILGLGLFFNQRLPQILSSTTENVMGIFVIAFSAVCWAGYALLQKVLLRNYSAMQLTLVLYCIGVMTLIPFSSPSALLSFNVVQGLALLFCCLNTLIAYSAFTEALRVWSASRVSAILALTPLFTYISANIAQRIDGDTFNQPELSMLAYIGGIIVIVGSITTALGRSKPRLA